MVSPRSVLLALLAVISATPGVARPLPRNGTDHTGFTNTTNDTNSIEQRGWMIGWGGPLNLHCWPELGGDNCKHPDVDHVAVWQSITDFCVKLRLNKDQWKKDNGHEEMYDSRAETRVHVRVAHVENNKQCDWGAADLEQPYRGPCMPRGISCADLLWQTWNDCNSGRGGEATVHNCVKFDLHALPLSETTKGCISKPFEDGRD
ncbi:hypothetical protein PG994_012417 [Apiospora phragmitis]|uniref:Uncharacterized protein n=1 Tax=Apiospora phragmitis TaxID=2905665 RepID=A0ABR1TVS0_9PEZI